jgi:hypothetical protein
MASKEHERLNEPHEGHVGQWRRWGPYLSERAWGTVREDYSANGTAWDYFPHDHARSRTYRWGEDGMAGISDRYQLLCFALALWNGRDPILKERMFGLVASETNHGEDVKEYYFYLDSTPTHSYMKYLYKYPQSEYPYAQLIEESRRRGGNQPEYELLDTGVFDEDRYFDVFVEYAKVGPEDIAVRIEAFNRGPDDASLHILPHLWFRNTWSWWPAEQRPEPLISLGPSGADFNSLLANDERSGPMLGLAHEYNLGALYLYADAGGIPLFTFNETNNPRIWGPQATSRKPYVKDAFHRCVVNGEREAVNPEPEGTKACLHYANLEVPAGGSVVVRLRLTSELLEDPLGTVDKTIELRRREADEFYDEVQPPNASVDERRVQRQALAGMLWSKQSYFYDVNVWLDGDDPAAPPPASRKTIRNFHWKHLNSMRVMSMPDKWEYPWFAAWDLAFHCVPLALVDAEFAKEQLWLLLFEQFQHPNGQIPAYEWEFSDLNPPVQAWAVWRVYNMDRIRSGRADREFLEKCFHKLLINFAWWVNKVDAQGNNIFEGGFLGLDNITVIDRSHALPKGTVLEQSDATGWMGMFCLNLMRIALELAKENRAYEGLATKFFQHYAYVGAAMKQMGEDNVQLWDDADKFFYDVLHYSNGTTDKFRVRSLVGLIPLYAIERLEEDWVKPFKDFGASLQWFLRYRQDIVQRGVTTLEHDGKRVHVLAMVTPEQMRGLLERVWDPSEFRSEHGMRSLSKFHEQHPFDFGGARVGYEPAESTENLKGGNSNWRGPVWFPTSFMMIESLRKLAKAYGSQFVIDSPVPGEPDIKLDDIARGFANRLISIFTRDETGRRPVHGRYEKFQTDPHWRDLLLFYEYFHGDTGAGLGASHQTGWTGLVASLIDEWRR